jgi:hypothetical protein
LAVEAQPAVATQPARRDELRLENTRVEWSSEPERPALRNRPDSAAAEFHGPEAEAESEEEEGESDARLTVAPEPFDRAPRDAPGVPASAGTMEEEEIEEEEADLTHYVEDLEEDAVFEEMEEETRAADDYLQATGEIPAAGEPGTESSAPAVDPFRSEAPVAADAEAPAGEEEADDAAEAEAELEEAQAEAEALLDAEARGNGIVEARAEVRAPAGAAYTQRTQRPGFDRDRRPGPRGRRGGRRFRSLKDARRFWFRLPRSPSARKGRGLPATSRCPAAFWSTCPPSTTPASRGKSLPKRSVSG